MVGFVSGLRHSSITAVPVSERCSMEFNEKLQDLRKRKGLTQEELAGAIFVSRTAISK